MKKSIVFLSLIILIQANPLCAMQRKERRSSGHHTSVLRVVPPVLTLALLLALVKPASGLGDFAGNCGSFDSACIREKMDERAKGTPPDFGRFGSPAYAQAVAWNYAERNRMDAEMRHQMGIQDHYQNLGHQQGYR